MNDTAREILKLLREIHAAVVKNDKSEEDNMPGTRVHGRSRRIFEAMPVGQLISSAQLVLLLPDEPDVTRHMVQGAMKHLRKKGLVENPYNDQYTRVPDKVYFDVARRRRNPSA